MIRGFSRREQDGSDHYHTRSKARERGRARVTDPSAPGTKKPRHHTGARPAGQDRSRGHTYSSTAGTERYFRHTRASTAYKERSGGYTCSTAAGKELNYG